MYVVVVAWLTITTVKHFISKFYGYKDLKNMLKHSHFCDICPCNYHEFYYMILKTFRTTFLLTIAKYDALNGSVDSTYSIMNMKTMKILMNLHI